MGWPAAQQTSLAVRKVLARGITQQILNQLLSIVKQFALATPDRHNRNQCQKKTELAAPPPLPVAEP